MRRQDCLALAALAALGLLVYANALPNSFVWDDQLLVIDNPDIRSLRNIPSLFVSGPFAGIGGNFYRPMQFVSYAIDYALWGLNPFGYHLTNMLIHSANAALVFFILLAVTGRRRAAFVAAALFVVHPINTEAVAYISGRADLLAAFFMYSSLIIVLNTESRIQARQFNQHCSRHLSVGYLFGISALASVLLFALALFTKEAAIVLPVLALLCVSVSRQRDEACRDGIHPNYGSSRHVSDGHVGGLIPLFAAAAAYLLIRLALRVAGLERPPSNPFPFFWRFLTSFKVILFYFWLLAFPHSLTMERVVTLERSVLSPSVLLPMAALAGIGLAASRARRSVPGVFFGIAWFFVTLLPYLNWFPLNAEMADHWLYIASVGFFLLAALTLEKLPGRACHVAIIAIIACLSCLTIRRNLDWRNEETIFMQTVRSSPGSPRAHYNAGNVYLKKGQPDEAAREYRESLRIKPGDSKVHKNLGNALLQLGRTGEAIAEFESAVSIEPYSADTHMKLGAAYGMAGMNERAMQVLAKAIELDPASAQAHNNLASVYTNMQRFREAQIEYEQALAIDPAMIEANFNLGIVYFHLGEKDKAVAQFEKALLLKPDFAPARKWLERVKAGDAMKSAIEVAPPPQ
jgi:tetratricopeptide (TPR) repeat protein